MLSPPLHSLLGFARPTLFSTLRTQIPAPTNGGPSLTRFRHQLAPRKVTFVKRHKGVIPIPIGGSVKGSTLAYGDWGIRIKGEGARFSAKQLKSAEEVVKRKIKTVKGAKVFLRVFPDIPVCIKVCRSLRLSVTPSLTKRRETKPVWGKERERLSFGRLGTLLSTLSKMTVTYHPPFPEYQQDVSYSRLAVHWSVRSWLVMVWLCYLPATSLLKDYAALRQAGNKIPTI